MMDLHTILMEIHNVIIIYSLVFVWGIGFPGEYANNEHISAWWHPVIVALLMGAAAALLAFAIPYVVRVFALGSAIGCVIGIVGAPFWGNTNQETGLSVGLAVALMVLGVSRAVIQRVSTTLPR